MECAVGWGRMWLVLAHLGRFSIVPSASEVYKFAYSGYSSEYYYGTYGSAIGFSYTQFVASERGPGWNPSHADVSRRVDI